MLNFSEKQLNIYIFILVITFLILSVVSFRNFGTILFFNQIFPAVISLQILTLFFGIKIKNYKSNIKPITKYFSFILLLLSGFTLTLFTLSIVNFGFSKNILLVYQILTPLLILSVLIIIIPIHVKLINLD